MRAAYLIRLDDASPYMDKERWERVEYILDKYNIKPLVGIVPANADQGIMLCSDNPQFWGRAREWERKGWEIAMHGYQHLYHTTDGGINPVWDRSEFAGLAYPEQKGKIQKGYEILKEHGLNPRWFFAPSHTFDANTIKALQDSTEIRRISDTIGMWPYRMGNDMSIAPCQYGRFRRILIPGCWTFCFHPNEMGDSQFEDFEYFIRKYREYFISYRDLSMSGLRSKDIFSRILSWMYFAQRRLAR